MTQILGVAVVVVLLGYVVWLVGGPLRQPGKIDVAPKTNDHRDLEAARDAKYREIRDNELDFRTGKLSETDFRALDRQLRAEAVEILHRLDRLG